MGGDLNLKKSWHPVLMSNQRRVWEEEKKALDERKRTEQRVKELKEERAKEEIQAKLEAAGSRKRIDRVDWMYQGPSSGQTGTTEEMEGYLLGKRRIDGLIKGTEHKNLEKQATQDSFMALQSANTLRDTASKIREDPMLAIKKQEQAAYEAMMNDPIKRRQLLAIAGKGGESIAKKEKKHRRHHHRHRDESDEEQGHKRRRRDDDERQYRSGRPEYRRRRSDSFSRSTSPIGRRESVDRPRRRSVSPRRRSLSTDERRMARADRERYYERQTRNTSSADSRSPSRDHRRMSVDRRKSYANDRDYRDHRDHRDGRHQERESRGHESRRNGNGHHWRDDRGQPPDRKDSSNDFEAERRRKLAAMQQDASSLDMDREKRLAALAEKERITREADDKARAKSSKYSDKGDFVNALHRKAGEMALGDRIGRGRQGLIKDED